ncbi:MULTISPECIES: phasin family protein [Pseudomonas]|uniref:Phasin family protein n=1 Tax=Pseudomonas quercus TaxID=2722792 RepID=A0ABX0YEN4_9PSED|nr:MULTISPECIES: phasin family protein [Pseudomonas]MBF7142141.1 phasin family protein [Pseudomonas sp. LY10J]NJP00679.1 phasin family protein [Pseudomonas quercus]
MAGKKKTEKEAASRVGGIEKSSRQIWLAGLGAYARASADGSKLFDELLKEGEQVEKQVRTQASKPADKAKASTRSKVEDLKEKALGKWEALEEAFDKRLDSAISRLGVPSRHEVAALNEKVDVLMGELKRLADTKAPKAPPAAPAGRAPKALPGTPEKADKPAAPKPELKKVVGKAAAKPAASSAPSPDADKKTRSRKPAVKAVPTDAVPATDKADSNA